MCETSLFNYNAGDFVEIEDEEFEDEEIEEYNENKNISIKGKGDGSSSRNIWRKSRQAQINECQLKLFGKEQPKREYSLNDETKDIIIEYYKNENPDFKEAAEHYLNLSAHLKQKNMEVYL